MTWSEVCDNIDKMHPALSESFRRQTKYLWPHFCPPDYVKIKSDHIIATFCSGEKPSYELTVYKNRHQIGAHKSLLQNPYGG